MKKTFFFCSSKGAGKNRRRKLFFTITLFHSKKNRGYYHAAAGRKKSPLGAWLSGLPQFIGENDYWYVKCNLPPIRIEGSSIINSLGLDVPCGSSNS